MNISSVRRGLLDTSASLHALKVDFEGISSFVLSSTFFIISMQAYIHTAFSCSGTWRSEHNIKPGEAFIHQAFLRDFNILLYIRGRRLLNPDLIETAGALLHNHLFLKKNKRYYNVHLHHDCCYGLLISIEA